MAALAMTSESTFASKALRMVRATAHRAYEFLQLKVDLSAVSVQRTFAAERFRAVLTLEYFVVVYTVTMPLQFPGATKQFAATFARMA